MARNSVLLPLPEGPSSTNSSPSSISAVTSLTAAHRGILWILARERWTCVGAVGG